MISRMNGRESHPNSQSALSSSDSPNFIYIRYNWYHLVNVLVKLQQMVDIWYRFWSYWSNRTRCVPGRPDWKAVLGAVCQRRKVFFVLNNASGLHHRNYLFMQKVLDNGDGCRHQNGWILKKKIAIRFSENDGVRVGGSKVIWNISVLVASSVPEGFEGG